MRHPSRFCSSLLSRSFLAAALAASVTACAGDEGVIGDEDDASDDVDQSRDETFFKRGCGTMDLSPQEMAADDLVMSRTPATDHTLRAIGQTINVYVHVIQSASGAGNVTDQQIAAQLDVLNDAYAPTRFALVSTDRTRNNKWYTTTGGKNERSMKQALRRGSADD